VKRLKLIRIALVMMTLTVIAAAVRVAITGSSPAVAFADVPSSPAGVRVEPARPDSIARLIATRNPFRLGRAPSSVPFDPRASLPGAPPMPPPVPRPPLTLAGLLLGPPHAALIEGLPGSDGARLMRAGERVGDYVLRSIATDHVVVAGRDTTWTLRLRNRYQ